ncbi:MAG: hypothetical protein ABSH47_13320 [Bryobacteraceae bacterium]|jgi:hypothetical protein
MPRQFVFPPALRWDELAAYHQDVVDALHLYFSPVAPTFAVRFVGRTQDEVRRELASRVDESDLRSALAVLTSLEAGFRIDFDFRCQNRLKDGLSRHFRELAKSRGEKVPLDDILEAWKEHGPYPATVSELRGAFKFRHWLAHGRLGEPKLGRRYDFFGVHLMARSIIAAFPFEA